MLRIAVVTGCAVLKVHRSKQQHRVPTTKVETAQRKIHVKAHHPPPGQESAALRQQDSPHNKSSRHSSPDLGRISPDGGGGEHDCIVFVLQLLRFCGGQALLLLYLIYYVSKLKPCGVV